MVTSDELLAVCRGSLPLRILAATETVENTSILSGFPIKFVRDIGVSSLVKSVELFLLERTELIFIKSQRIIYGTIPRRIPKPLNSLVSSIDN